MNAFTSGADIAPAVIRVLDDPVRGVEHIRQEFRDGAPDAVGRADLLILLAEALHRAGNLFEARRAQHDALGAIAGLQPPDRRRLVSAIGVGADLAVCGRRLDAVPICTEYLAEAVRDSRPDPRQVVLAGALRAVAIFHASSCEDGRRLMRILRERVAPEDAAAEALEAGIGAMDIGCRPGCAPLVQEPLPPWPGAVLAPYDVAPAADCLARRIVLYPAVHTCDLSLLPEAATSAGTTS